MPESSARQLQQSSEARWEFNVDEAFDSGKAEAQFWVADVDSDTVVWSHDAPNGCGGHKSEQFQDPGRLSVADKVKQRILLHLQAAAKSIHDDMLQICDGSELALRSHIVNLEKEMLAQNNSSAARGGGRMDACKTDVVYPPDYATSKIMAAESLVQQRKSSGAAQSTSEGDGASWKLFASGHHSRPIAPHSSNGSYPHDRPTLSRGHAHTLSAQSSGSSVGDHPHKRGSFRLLPQWENTQQEGSDSRSPDASIDESRFAQQLYLQSGEGRKAYDLSAPSEKDVTPPERSSTGCVMHPCGFFRMHWDMLAFLFLSYDIYTIPLSAFEIPPNTLTFYLAAAALFYWTLDMPLSFLAGFYLQDGEVEMRPRQVACHYTSRWLVPDITILLIDWLTFGQDVLDPDAWQTSGSSAGGGAAFARLGKVSRFARLMRLLRLLRIRKLLQAVAMIHNLIGFESTGIILGICKNILGIVLLNHFLAAIWFTVGLQHEDEGWLAGRKSDFWFKNYVMSLQWAIANFTPGTSTIQPITTEEMTFHVFVLFFALVVFSVFVSSTTSMITKLMQLQSTHSQKLWRLKQFLLQHRFPVELRDRVYRYANATGSRGGSHVQDIDAEILHMLSKPLQREVQCFARLSVMKGHTFMKMLTQSNPSMMKSLCTEALGDTLLTKGDELFTVGDRIERMFFVASGSLSYRSPTDTQVVQLRYRSSFCEAALWTNWHCRGTMVADAKSALLELSCEALVALVSKHHLTRRFVKNYAAAFVDDLNAVVLGEVLHTALSDVQDHFVSEGNALQNVLLTHKLLGAVAGFGTKTAKSGIVKS